MKKMKLLIDNKLLFISFICMTIMLLFQIHLGGFRMPTIVMHLLFYFVLAALFNDITKKLRKTLQETGWHLLILPLCIAMFFYFVQYVPMRETETAILAIVSFLAVWMELNYHQPWILVLFSLILIVFDTSVAILIIPALALLAYASSAIAIESSTKKTKQPKRKKEQEQETHILFQCYLPIAALCTMAVGITFYRAIRSNGVVATDTELLSTLLSVIIRLFPCCIPLVYFTLQARKEKSGSACFKKMVLLVGLPFFVLPLALAAGNPDTLFFGYLIMVLIQYIAFMAMLLRKDETMIAITRRKASFINSCVLLCPIYSIWQYWYAGSF